MRAAGSSAVTNIGATTQVLAGRERAEVDERRLQLERGAQRAVVGLVDRAGAVGVRERAAGRVEARRRRDP